MDVPSSHREPGSKCTAGAKVSSATTIQLEVTDDDAAGARARGHDVSLELQA